MLRTANMRSAVYMMLAMAGYVFNDVFMKDLAQDMSMGQAIVMRGVVASVLITLIAWRSGALRPIRIAFKRMPLQRTIGESLATVLFLTALAHMPLANVAAILQALPLAVTVGAALFLGEAVGWRRWVAILIGFTGVLIVIRPGIEGYTPYALLVVAAVFFAALRDLSTRVMDVAIPSLFLSALTAVAVTFSGMVMWISSGEWAAIDATHIIKSVAASIFILVGYQFIVLAMREGDISFVVPFRYTSLLWSILLGAIVFSDFPDVFTVVGSAVIVITGLYTLYREHELQKRA